MPVMAAAWARVSMVPRVLRVAGISAHGEAGWLTKRC
jgi:hypothetical protein